MGVCEALHLPTQTPPYQADVTGLPDLMQTGTCPSRHICECSQPSDRSSHRSHDYFGRIPLQTSTGVRTGAIRSCSSPISQVYANLRCGTCTRLKRRLLLHRSSRGAAQRSRMENYFRTCRCRPLEVLVSFTPMVGRLVATRARALTEALHARACTQVEFHLNPERMAADRMLLEVTRENDGWVPIATVLSFPRMRKLCHPQVGRPRRLQRGSETQGLLPRSVNSDRRLRPRSRRVGRAAGAVSSIIPAAPPLQHVPALPRASQPKVTPASRSIAACVPYLLISRHDLLSSLRGNMLRH